MDATTYTQQLSNYDTSIMHLHHHSVLCVVGRHCAFTRFFLHVGCRARENRPHRSNFIRRSDLQGNRRDDHTFKHQETKEPPCYDSCSAVKYTNLAYYPRHSSDDSQENTAQSIVRVPFARDKLSSAGHLQASCSADVWSVSVELPHAPTFASLHLPAAISATICIRLTLCAHVVCIVEHFHNNRALFTVYRTDEVARHYVVSWEESVPACVQGKHRSPRVF